MIDNDLNELLEDYLPAIAAFAPLFARCAASVPITPRVRLLHEVGATWPKPDETVKHEAMAAGKASL